MKNKAIAFLLLILCCCLGRLSAQHDSQWQIHLTCSTYEQMVRHQGRIFLVADGNLFSTSADSLSSPAYYSRLSGLSGTLISRIAHTDASDQMVIVYADGNIDIIDRDMRLTNIPDFANKALAGSRHINDVRQQDGLFYISGDFGFFVLDPVHAVITQSYLTQEPVYCTYTFDHYLFYSTDSGLYASLIGTSSNPDWQRLDSSVKVRQAVITEGKEYRCWVLTNDNKLLYQTASSSPFNTFWGSAFNFLKADSTRLYTLFGNGPAFISLEDFSYCYVQQQYCRSAVDMIPSGDSTFYFLDPLKGIIISRREETDQANQLVLNTLQECPLPEQLSTSVPGQMFFHDGYLHCANIGRFRTLGSGGMSALHPYLSTLDTYSGIWNNTDLYALHPQTKGIIAFSQDRKNPSRFYFGTLGKGLFVVQGDSLLEHYTPENSAIADCSGLTNYYRIGATYMDQNGYLWMANAMTDSVLCCLTPGGRWLKYPIKGFSGDPVAMPGRIIEGQRDPYHFKWIYDIGIKGCYTAMYYDNGTPELLADDESACFSSLTDQDGNVINPNYMNDIVEDLDGKIWLMTSSGPFVIERPIDCYNHPGQVRRIKIPRNDGTNLADYLLPDVDCICCAIDAANRKWIGTNGNGLYCISADGLTQIENFTTSNSPLLTNDILALTYDDETGTLYISCEGGILSYTTDAIRGEESFSNVYCYPNPVRPDYTGDLVIRGLMDDSQVAITDASGHVVYRAQSAGGSITWDLTTSSERRVAPGVYLIMATDADGKEGIVSRFLVTQ